MTAKTSEHVVVAGLCILVAVAVIGLIYLARALILPIVLAIFLGLVLQPVVRQLCNSGMNRPAASAVTLALALAVLGAGFYRLGAPATDWLERVPAITQKLEGRFYELRQSITAAQEASEQIEGMTRDDGSDDEPVVVAEETFTGRMVGQMGALVTQAGITVGLLYFLLAVGSPTVDRVIEAFEMQGVRRQLREVRRDVERRCVQYLSTVALINIGVGIVTALAMWALRVPDPELWGLLAAGLNFMPYLGPAVMLAVLAAIGIVSFEEPLAMALPALAFGAITTIEGQFITPAVVGRQLTLNPIAVFVAIVAWYWLWGVVGAILAVPLLATTKIVADQLPVLAPLSAFLGRPERKRRGRGADETTKPA